MHSNDEKKELKVTNLCIRGIRCWDKGFIVMWDANIGLGELTFYHENGGNIHCETEHMSREFVCQVLEELGKLAIIHDC